MVSRSSVFGVNVVCQGDPTTTGGKVLEGTPHHTEQGIPMALQGHTVYCPACKQVGKIAQGCPQMTVMGVGAALHDYPVACGCPPGSNRLIAGKTVNQASTTTPTYFPTAPTQFYSTSSLSESPPLPPPLPVFAKSCLRGEGCTDAGTTPEPISNFGDFMLFTGEEEIPQHAQAAKRPQATPQTPPAQAAAAPLTAGMANAVLQQISGVSGAGRWLAPNPVALLLVGMFYPREAGKDSDQVASTQDYLRELELRHLASIGGKAPTRVRFHWRPDAVRGGFAVEGFHTEDGTNDKVRVRQMKFNEVRGHYEFTADGESGPTIIWTPADPDNDTVRHTGGLAGDFNQPTILVNPIPSQSDSQTTIFPAPEDKNFNDYILVFPDWSGMPPIYVMLHKKPTEFLEVELYSDFDRRPRQGMQADHMPSAAAVKANLRRKYPDAKPAEIDRMAKDVAAIIIPADIHQKLSNTYGGRNNPAQIDRDSRNLRSALDRDIQAIRPALKGRGATDEQIDEAKAKMHKLNQEQGLYE